MRFFELKALSDVFNDYEKIHHIKRVNDNVIEIRCARDIFYFDMTRSKSSVFIAPQALIAPKHYGAPFDVMLSRCNQALILDCAIMGIDRVIRFNLLIQKSYKQEEVFLQFEFSGKHTNVILLSKQEVVLEALRHIPANKSSRYVKVGTTLLPLPPNPKTPAIKDINKQELFALLKANYTDKITTELAQEKQILITNLTKQKIRLEHLLYALPKQESLLSQSQHLNTQATLLLANIYRINNYQTQVELKDFENKPITISLPLSRSPKEAIYLLFKESKKLAKKAKNIHLQQENIQAKIDFLTQEINFLIKSNNPNDIKILNPPRSKKTKSLKFETFFIEGFKISIGRNRHENQELLESAKADDLWLHIKDVPSSHMIIHCGKQKVYENVIYKAGEILVGLCKIQSGNFCVDYTRRRFVKIIQGANVRYTKYQSLHYKK